jgi:hypothetical protein
MAIDRHSLVDWLLPHCEPGTASVMYPKGKNEGPGWVNGEADVERAIAAYRAGTLGDERFSSMTQDGKKYVIAGGTRMGLVPHRDGMVARFCMDFDDHAGDGGNVHLAEAVDRFLGATSIKFSSKSGKGLHCYYALAEPIAVDTFVELAKTWGFNRRGDIECFPKTPKRSQVWLPNEPNEQGGDTYRGGSLEDAVSPARLYAHATEGEAKCMADATFREICKLPMPEPFRRLWTSDVLDWIESQPPDRKESA